MNTKIFLRDNSPDFFCNVYHWSKKNFIPLKYRVGKDYFKILRHLEESQWWSQEHIIRFQWNNIKSLLDNAYTNVPYYRKLFTEHKLHPEDIKTFSDFEKIPFLTKEDFKHNKEKLLSHKFSRYKVARKYTTGTTGSPVNFFEEKNTAVRESAFYRRFWNFFGYNFNNKCAMLRANSE